MLQRPTHIPKSFSDDRDYISDLLDEPETLGKILNFPSTDNTHIPVQTSGMVVPESGLLLPTPSPTEGTTRRRLVSSRAGSRVRRQMVQAGYGVSQQITDSFSASQLITLANEWNADLVDSGHSKKTAELRAMLIKRLDWFLTQAGYSQCGMEQIQHFFRHLRDGHLLPQGRWGKGSDNHGHCELRPATLATYDRHFRAFFSFLVSNGFLTHNPMDALRKQQGGSDQKVPYTLDQVRAFIREAQKSKYPKRNESIIRFLFDTGVRADELCSLRMGQVDLFQRRARVLGKGNRNRVVAWGKKTGMVLRAYMRDEYFAPNNYAADDPLFITATGKNSGEALTYTGLRQLIRKTGARAGIQVAQCSPHIFRHTFAIVYLRRGGDLNTLQFLLGHSSLKTTQIYVNMAFADIESKHRMFSPGDALEI